MFCLALSVVYVTIKINLIRVFNYMYLQTHNRWRSREPHEIGTLALSLCIDPNLVQFDIPTPEHQLKGM